MERTYNWQYSKAVGQMLSGAMWIFIDMPQVLVMFLSCISIIAVDGVFCYLTPGGGITIVSKAVSG